MFEPIKINVKNPIDAQAKLAIELAGLLADTTTAFIRLNVKTYIEHDLFLALRDGAIACTGTMIFNLIEMLTTKKDKKRFINEAVGIFNEYIKDFQEKINNG